MLGHASHILKEKRKKKRLQNFLSYWTNTDCTTPRGDVDPCIIHSYCQNFNIGT